MNDDKVEIQEWYEGAKIVRKTANGIDIPIGHPAIPAIITHTSTFTRKQVEEMYGKDWDTPHTN